MLFRHRMAPFALALAALTLPFPGWAGKRSEVLNKTAEVLEARYIDQSQGARLGAMLREADQAGRFDEHSDPDAFAKAVTGAMRETVADLHLQMRYHPEHETDPEAGAETVVRRQDDNGVVRQVRRNARMDERTLAEIAATNYGVGKVEMLAGGIGYLQINRFVNLDLAQPALRKAIEQIADSEAVIIDLRGNVGGDPQAVGELLSPFFSADKPKVELHVAENRAMGVRDSVITDPSQARAKLAAAPLYILTDQRSASAAELAAYSARRVGRATLVGARTAGAGNGANQHSVGRGFALRVSEWKVLTGPGWERIGVSPDIEVAPEQALEQTVAMIRNRTLATAGRGSAI